MFRVLSSLGLFALLLWSCSSDGPSTCSGHDPNFIAVLKLKDRPLPQDTVVHVIYAGSGTEDFRLAEPDARHEVVFCRIADRDGVPLEHSAQQSLDEAGAAGATGAAGAAADSPNGVASLHCELWTAGFATLRVSGSGFPTEDHELTPKDGQCTLQRKFVLDDAQDAG